MLRGGLAKVAWSIEPVGVLVLKVVNSRLDSKKVVESELKCRERCAGTTDRLLNEYSQGENLRVQDRDRLVWPNSFDNQGTRIN
jgi:hypothetical protein